MKRQSTKAVLAASLAGVWLTDASPAMSQVCYPSSVTQFQGVDLGDAKVRRSGVAFDGTGTLTLNKAASDFNRAVAPIAFPSPTLPVFAAAGNLDGDAKRDDFVAGDGNGETRVYLYNEATLQFEAQAPLLPGGSGNMVLAAGDFDGDGDDDIFRADYSAGGSPSAASLWLNDGSGNFGGASTALPSTDLGSIDNGGTTAVAHDYNGDNRLDLLIGGSGGEIRIFLNDGASPPSFRYAGNLDVDLGLSGSATTPVFAFADFDGDGIGDLVAGAPSCCSDPSTNLRLFRGHAGGGFGAPQSIDFPGNAVAVLAADFSRDGRPDLIVNTDDSGAAGGQVLYYENNAYQLSRMTTPFPKAPVTVDNTLPDVDLGIVLDYDGNGLMDYLVADASATASYVVFTNAEKVTYAPCGEAVSEVVDLGALSTTEMRIAAVRMQALYVPNGGKVQFYASAEQTPLWVPMHDCGDGTGDLCVRLPASTGRSLRWKAEMCASTDRSTAPSITGVDVAFDYVEASEHYLAGIIVDDGVSYISGLRQPGNRGVFYAARADLGVVDPGTGQRYYWEASEVLDDPAKTPARYVYTAIPDPADPTKLQSIELSTANASALQDLLLAGSAAQASTVIDWARSQRFDDGVIDSSLGAIATATPAVLTKPGLPIWYTRAGTDDRIKVDAFINDKSTRKPLAMVGSKAGMIHAFYNNPTDTLDTKNGVEMWAFVPPYVARQLVADHTTSTATGKLHISAYPDGSPTLVDIKDSSGNLFTLALVGSGKGGKSIVALDVTETLPPPAAVTPPPGPTPLWHITPGGADAGQGYAKPVVARVKIGGSERFIVIVGTGVGHEDAITNDERIPGVEPAPPLARGRIVAAYDLADGSPLWRFRTVCPLTSEITVFETDDPEAGVTPVPKLDGFMDRAVFADECGYLYKVDPARDLNGGWNDNAGLGAIPAEKIGATQLYALFSTKASTLSTQRPIAGNIAARSDDSTRIVLFFGTGGIEQASPNNPNAFFAVYADDGQLRNPAIAPLCSPRCPKFYGGVVVNSEQVIAAQAVDPEIGVSNPCDLGQTTIVARDLNDFGLIDFSQTWAGMLTGGFYSRGGALYFTTSAGEAGRLGTPAAVEAGGETSAGITQPTLGGEGSEVGSNDPLYLLGWQQVY